MPILTKIGAGILAALVFIGGIWTAARKYETQSQENNDLQQANEYQQKEREIDDEIDYRD